jgi:ribose transport system ATP-binding protein
LVEASAPGADERDESVVSLIGVTKRFEGVVALSAVSVDLYPGEVLVLLGENGAGKSTLVNLLIGALQPDEGMIRVRGRAVLHQDPAAARRQGINAVLQDFSLAPSLSVADNLFLGREPHRLGLRDRARIHAEARRALDLLGMTIDVDTPVAFLGRAEQQMVEIVKALCGRPGVLILDEPTATLTEEETHRLFAIVARLKSEHWAILYITHRLEEVRRLGDRVMVLRDGRCIAACRVGDVSEDQLIADMVGRPLSVLYPAKATARSTRALLKAESLTTRDGRVADVSLEVREGEIVGIAGLVRAGCSEVARACFGLIEVAKGTVEICGTRLLKPDPRTMLRLGMVYLPQDRRGEALALSRSIEENVALEALASPRLSPFGIVRHALVHREVTAIVERLDVRPRNIHQPVVRLSGGNQQKVVLGRALTRPRLVYIFDEPTAGVDVGARQAIYRHMHELCATGAGVLFVSSDLEEVVHLAARVYVMHEGRVRAELAGEEIDAATVIRHSFGLDSASGPTQGHATGGGSGAAS